MALVEILAADGSRWYASQGPGTWLDNAIDTRRHVAVSLTPTGRREWMLVASQITAYRPVDEPEADE